MLPDSFYYETLPRLVELSATIITSFDSTKYANSVGELCGQEPQHSELDAQVEVIKNSTDLSSREKLTLLKEISTQRETIRDNEIERKRAAADIIDKSRERRCKLFIKVLGVVFTGGTSMLPDAVRYFKKKSQDEIVIVPKLNTDI